jgi:phosphomannomutase
MMSAHSTLIVSVSGIRGIVGQSLTPAAAVAFGSALGTHVQGGPVVVSRDGRPSGAMLRHAVLAGLTAAGCTIHDLGVTSTPTVGLAVRTLGAAGGVQITASHNPAPWNGLKLFGSDGRVLSASEGKKVAALFEAGTFRSASWDQIGTVRTYEQAKDDHADRVLELIDANRVRAAQFWALLDGNGGAGGPLGLSLLRSLGVQIIDEGCDADGIFRHEPEPTAENLRGICPKILEQQANVGFALDPDSDRLALIDETGRYIGEELTLALAVRYRLEQQQGPVVVNMSTSRVVADIADRFGCVFERSAVGEANVADRMLSVNAVIGGEGNGGVIDPRVGFVRDPFVGMAMVLDLMASTGRKLSELANELPKYSIIKDKYTVAPERLPALYDALRARWPEAKADHQDGLRLDWADRWVHVRPSNTEPIVRVIAEAPDSEDAAQLCREVGELLA